MSLNILKECGYNKGLCRLLNTDVNTGIIGDKVDLQRRQEIFGKHFISMPKISTFYKLLCSQFEDSNIIFLIWAATLYLVFSVFGDRSSSYIESLTIYFAVMFTALISAFCDWIKEKQYLSLKDEINNQTVTVFRGAHGTACSVSIRELVVGDVVQINQGDRIPADCIILEEISLEIDQSMYNKREIKVKKEESQLN